MYGCPHFHNIQYISNVYINIPVLFVEGCLDRPQKEMPVDIAPILVQTVFIGKNKNIQILTIHGVLRIHG